MPESSHRLPAAVLAISLRSTVPAFVLGQPAGVSPFGGAASNTTSSNGQDTPAGGTGQAGNARISAVPPSGNAAARTRRGTIRCRQHMQRPLRSNQGPSSGSNGMNPASATGRQGASGG